MDASLIMNMELGGVSTWSKQSEGPPAPGHTDDLEGGGDGASAGDRPSPLIASTEEEGLPQAPPLIGRSKFLAQEVEDPFAEEGGGGTNGDGGQRHKKRGKQKGATFDEIALE